MDKELYELLRQITEEERKYLDGAKDFDPAIYTSEVAKENGLMIDSAQLLKKGIRIEVRPHTRFVHFPRHTHNYVEMIYMYSGSTTHILNDSERNFVSKMVTRVTAAVIMTGTIISGGFLTGNLFTADIIVFSAALLMFLLTFFKSKND